MKILHILYSGLGGHGNVFFSMCDADKDREFTYLALFFGVENVNQEYINKAINKNISWDFVEKKRGTDIKAIKRIADIIINSRCDIIFLHSSAYILPAIIANLRSSVRRKIIVRETQANNLKSKKEWFWLSMGLLFAKKIVFLSEEYRQEVAKKLGLIYNKKKVTVIPNGIDLAIYYPQVNTNTKEFIIGMQSRLVKIKDHITLLKAFALIKKSKIGLTQTLKLKIAGEGETELQLKRLAVDLNIQDYVEFTGNLIEKDLVKFLQSLHLYVHASFGETMSTAIMQAMACGLPIIASDVKGINNMIIPNKTGILVPVNNEELLADATKITIENYPVARELGVNANLFAKENYSNTSMFKKYKKLFTI